MIFLLSGIALLLVLIERIWPGNELPSSKAWWLRIFVINTVQVGILILAGHTWDRWFQKASPSFGVPLYATSSRLSSITGGIAFGTNLIYFGVSAISCTTRHSESKSLPASISTPSKSRLTL